MHFLIRLLGLTDVELVKPGGTTVRSFPLYNIDIEKTVEHRVYTETRTIFCVAASRSRSYSYMQNCTQEANHMAVLCTLIL